MQRPANLRWSLSTKPFGPHVSSRRAAAQPSKWATAFGLSRTERRGQLLAWVATGCVFIVLGFNLLLLALSRKSVKLMPLLDPEELQLPVEVQVEVVPRSSDACAQALHIDKVALLFLAHEGFKHAELWKLWFSSLAGLLPVETIQTKGCVQGLWEAIADACWVDPGSPIIQQQKIMSVYVHIPENASEVLAGTLFDGHHVAKSVPTEWGTHSLVTATKTLLVAALKDPLNAYFVLLSETTIPLYPPATVYRQLLAEDKSRINACPIGNRDLGRWSDRMDREWLHRSHWRKSWQWFGLKRKHALVVAQDVRMDHVFKKHCFTRFDPDYQRERFCVSDEHYIPTLLASRDLDKETDCYGLLTNVDFSRGGPHPRSYSVKDVNLRLLKRLRGKEQQCEYKRAISSAPPTFVHVDANLTDICGSDAQRYESTLEYGCPLFARKFPEESAEKLLHLSACSAPLGILPHSEACASPVKSGFRGVWNRIVSALFIGSSRKS